MENHILEWLNLAVRWLHITAGIAWIGNAFFFNWLENHLEKQNSCDKVEGDLWAIHSGGFYHFEKYKDTPAQLPAKLHGFIWESYITWISGFSLLVIVYYFNAKLYLINPQSLLSPALAIFIGISLLGVSWYIYDFLCKSKLVQYDRAFLLLSIILITAIAFGLTQVFSQRAAYIHIGALLGTLMAGNVFFVIIPGQRQVASLAKRGEKINDLLGKKSLQRALHNNYMILPVLFIMISNHFPSTFAHKWNWLILTGIILIGGGVRHWFNLRGRGQKNFLILPLAAVGMFGLLIFTRPHAIKSNSVVSSVQAMEIIQRRCSSCHSANPTDDVFKTPPSGVTFDNLTEVRARYEQVKLRVVMTKSMPLGNKTQMTDNERSLIGQWLIQQLLNRNEKETN
jgi:uncharacterized membrane protein